MDTLTVTFWTWGDSFTLTYTDYGEPPLSLSSIVKDIRLRGYLLIDNYVVIPWHSITKIEAH